MSETIFGKIVAGEIPAKIVYEDDDVMAFHDVAPQAPTHVLVIPKKPLRSVLDAGEDDVLLLGKLMYAATHVARLLDLADAGFRIVTNIGSDGGQSVDYLHLHVLGGRHMGWPPG
jgi:histidine triad (HIT) family protein